MGSKWWIIVGLMVAAVCWGSAEEGSQEDGLPAFSLPQDTQTQIQSEAQNEQEFPFVIRGTGLIAQYFAQYEGPFLEDEVQEPVTDIAALMVYNPGAQFVKRASILLQQGNRTLVFDIMMLPPGSRVLVLEKNGCPYTTEAVIGYQCVFVETEQRSEKWEIAVAEREGALYVTNQMEYTVSDVVLYYKQYNSVDGFYLGGYAYTQRIGTLGAEEEKKIDLFRYVSGNSRVVLVSAAK